MTRRLSAVFFVLALSALAFMTVTPAQAVMVTYSTTGGFSASGGASSATFGAGANTLTLAYAGIASSTVNANPTTNGSAGTITASVAGTGGTASGNFTLTINQTTPSVAGGSLSGALSGTITSNSSNGTLEFASTTLVLGDVKYTLLEEAVDANGNPGYDLVPPSTNDGHTTIQMRITATAVPEPAFFGLTGLGFLGLSGIAFRRYRQARG